jgi:hypothetical protein
VRVIFTLTAIGGLGLVSLGVWPGLIEDLVFGFPFNCAWLPLLLCWFVVLIYLAVRDLGSGAESLSNRRWWGVRSAAIMFGTLCLLWLHMPQRVAFAFCYSQLHKFVENLPVDEFRNEKLGRQVGPYWVDRYAADKRGGVFFRTATGPGGIGPDEISYGFAFRPNGRGSPFGNSHYWHRHLFGNWYVFEASNDW